MLDTKDLQNKKNYEHDNGDDPQDDHPTRGASLGSGSGFLRCGVLFSHVFSFWG